MHALNAAAFETRAEADLVDALREQATPIVSLVAEDEADGSIVGHVMFSPVTLSGHPELTIMGLAPLAVAPGRRSEGVGSALVRAGLEAVRGTRLRCGGGAGASVVLPALRLRTVGAASASAATYDAPEEAFMVVELQARVLGRRVRHDRVSPGVRERVRRGAAMERNIGARRA